MERLKIIFFVLITVSFGAGVSLRHTSEEAKFWKAMAKVKVIPPPGAPSAGQASIDLAVIMFGIKVPPNVTGPTFDPSVRDRGITTTNPFFVNSVVRIGPAAFDSWSILASTLAHELEIHCNQRMVFVLALDRLGFDGILAAEQQAYRYELRNAQRFGTNEIDRQAIEDTMNMEYSEKADGLSAWVADNLFMLGTK